MASNGCDGGDTSNNQIVPGDAGDKKSCPHLTESNGGSEAQHTNSFATNDHDEKLSTETVGHTSEHDTTKGAGKSKKGGKAANVNLSGAHPQEDSSAPKSRESATSRNYKFWSTQPVPKIDEQITPGVNEPFEVDKSQDELRHEPYTLPEGFKWDTLDIDQPEILTELYTLLNENYVEDDENMFRFDYSPEFLRWALKPPGWLHEWHCGVRVQKNGKLVGFISAIPVLMKIYNKQQKLVEINFLCVHKKLRRKRLAPVLIKEITRRVNCRGLFQAVYTAGVFLPKPVATCRYWHRSLNPKKLIDVQFSHLHRNMTMSRTVKLYKLPDETKTEGFRQMTSKDIPQAYALLSEHLRRFQLAPVLSEEEFRHWFVPRANVVDCYVVESEVDAEQPADEPAEPDADHHVPPADDAAPGAARKRHKKKKQPPPAAERKRLITDLISFYSLPSTVMHHAVHKSLSAAYSFYTVATKTPIKQLVNDALIVAKRLNFDVFNALDLMDNKNVLEELKFGIGDGQLQYYLYNWKCPDMKPEQVGLVLL